MAAITLTSDRQLIYTATRNNNTHTKTDRSTHTHTGQDTQTIAHLHLIATPTLRTRKKAAKKMCSHVRGTALAASQAVAASAATATAAEAEAAAPFCMLLSLYMPQHTIDSADIYVNNFSCCRSSSSASSGKRFNNSSGGSNNRKKSECIKCISVDVTMTLSPCFVRSPHTPRALQQAHTKGPRV